MELISTRVTFKLLPVPLTCRFYVHLKLRSRRRAQEDAEGFRLLKSVATSVMAQIAKRLDRLSVLIPIGVTFTASQGCLTGRI